MELYLASILGYGSAPALELTFSSSGHLFLLRGHAVTVTITFFLSKVRFGRLRCELDFDGILPPVSFSLVASCFKHKYCFRLMEADSVVTCPCLGFARFINT